MAFWNRTQAAVTLVAAQEKPALTVNAAAGAIAGNGAVTTYGQDLYGLAPAFQNVAPADFKWLYKYDGLAKRIIDTYPDETWRDFPAVYDGDGIVETPFELAWKLLAADTKIDLMDALRLWDKLSGIGQYGILVLGFDDGGTPDTEVTGTGRALMFCRPFDQSCVKIAEVDKEITSPRYGMPLTYTVEILGADQQKTTQTVHWTRVLHLAEDRVDSPLFGTPRIEPILLRVLEYGMLCSGSCHMYMRGAYPGFVFESGADVTITDKAIALMKSQLAVWVAGMTRVLHLKGVVAKSLAPQVSDPSPQIKVQIQAISIATGIPARMLIGSEQAVLASEQDTANFQRRVTTRRKGHATDRIVKVLVERLSLFGVLPMPAGPLRTVWVDEDAAARKSEAEIALIRAQILKIYADSVNAANIIPEDIFYSRLMGMSNKEVLVLATRLGLDFQAEGGDGSMTSATKVEALPNSGVKPPAKKAAPKVATEKASV